MPRPIKCDENVAKENGGAQRGEQTVDQAGFDPDILWLRNYFAGDPIRYIHWKASARTDILKTKQFSSATLPPLILDFDNIVIQNIERKLSCLTYLIMTLTNKNRPVGLRIRKKFFEPGLSRRHRFRMLNELALYGDPDDKHPD